MGVPNSRICRVKNGPGAAAADLPETPHQGSSSGGAAAVTGPRTGSEPEAATPRRRREPPRFRPVEVRRVERLNPRMVRVTLAGQELAGFATDLPAASVRLLLAASGDELVVPSWNGNEFLLPDGRRPTIRTFTPLRFDPQALELDIDIVLHDSGAASQWAEAVGPGAPAALSGPGRGYAVATDARAYVLAGDETAIPAISQLLAAMPRGMPVQGLIEVAEPEARAALGDYPAASVEWLDLPPGAGPGDALVPAVQSTDITEGTRVWVAGEAAAVQRIRRHLFEELGLPRSQASVRGYWKRGRSGDEGDNRSR